MNVLFSEIELPKIKIEDAKVLVRFFEKYATKGRSCHKLLD